MTQKIRPLSQGQQLLLQRLVASHVVTDDDLLEVYESIKTSDLGDMGRSLSNCLGTINASLGPAFGLEVRTVALSERVAPLSKSASSEEDDDTPSSSAKNGGAAPPVKYHSVVNKISDAMSKSHAHHGPYARNPHELELLKLILEQIVERHLEDLDNAAAAAAEEGEDGSSSAATGNGNGGGAVVGCEAGLKRMECINLRTKLKGPHANKVGLRDAERAISAFVAEGWLIATHKPKKAEETPSPEGDEEEEEGTGTQDSTGTPSSSSKRLRKRSRRSIDGLGAMDDDDCKPGRGNYLMIGPRTYMELPEALTDFGLGRERMPQFILHGSG